MIRPDKSEYADYYHKHVSEVPDVSITGLREELNASVQRLYVIDEEIKKQILTRQVEYTRSSGTHN